MDPFTQLLFRIMNMNTPKYGLLRAAMALTAAGIFKPTKHDFQTMDLSFILTQAYATWPEEKQKEACDILKDVFLFINESRQSSWKPHRYSFGSGGGSFGVPAQKKDLPPDLFASK